VTLARVSLSFCEANDKLSSFRMRGITLIWNFLIIESVFIVSCGCFVLFSSEVGDCSQRAWMEVVLLGKKRIRKESETRDSEMKWNQTPELCLNLQIWKQKEFFRYFCNMKEDCSDVEVTTIGLLNDFKDGFPPPEVVLCQDGQF